MSAGILQSFAPFSQTQYTLFLHVVRLNPLELFNIPRFHTSSLRSFPFRRANSDLSNIHPRIMKISTSPLLWPLALHCCRLTSAQERFTSNGSVTPCVDADSSESSSSNSTGRPMTLDVSLTPDNSTIYFHFQSQESFKGNATMNLAVVVDDNQIYDMALDPCLLESGATLCPASGRPVDIEASTELPGSANFQDVVQSSEGSRAVLQLFKNGTDEAEICVTTSLTAEGSEEETGSGNSDSDNNESPDSDSGSSGDGNSDTTDDSDSDTTDENDSGSGGGDVSSPDETETQGSEASLLQMSWSIVTCVTRVYCILTLLKSQFF